jgi:hypothetical protein
MDNEVVTRPKVGARVWTVNGLLEHGPSEGPKTNVPSGTGGKIVRTERPYVTRDQLLYVVEWDSGQSTKHYFGDLLVIGSFETIDEFRQAIVAGARPGTLVLGPGGGFREFTMEIEYRGRILDLKLEQDQQAIWVQVLSPMHEKGEIRVTTTRMSPKPRRAP